MSDPKGAEPVEARGAAGAQARGVGVNMLTLVAQASMPALHVQLARLLGATDYGLYVWASAFVDTLSVATLFGMDVAVSREVSLAHADKDARRAAGATGAALRIVTISGLAITLFVAIGAPWLARSQDAPGLVTPLRVLAVVPIAYHAASVFIVATQAKMVMKYEFFARGLFQPLSLLALTTVLVRAGGVVGASAGVAGGMILTAILTAYFYGREFPLRETLVAAWRRPLDRSLLRAGLPLVLTNVIGAVQGKLAAFFLGYYSGSAAVGAFGVCVLYVISLGQVRGAFFPVVCATVPPLLAAEDRAGLQAFFARQTRWVALLAMPLFALFAGFGDGLLAVFGPQYVYAAPALAILALGHLASVLPLATYALWLSGNVRYSAVAGIICIAVQCALLPLLVPRFGLTGAAVATAVAYVAAQGSQLAFVYRALGVHGMSSGLGKVIASALIALAAGRSLSHWLPAPLAVRFFAGVSVAAITYLAAVFAMGLDADERAILDDLVNKIRRRLRP